MEIFRTHINIPEQARGAVIAIGNFDGMHKGHQALLHRAREHVKKSGKHFGVLTFEPHPHTIFRPDDPPFRITPEAMKIRRLQEQGVDMLFCLHFDWAFASQGAETFIREILTQGLKPAEVIVGYDFRFGQLRKGSAQTIRQAGIPVTDVSEIADKHGEKFSSSTIRQYLRQGDIAKANTMLGWDWEIEGTVKHGDRRGHALGFPTANLSLGETIHPAYGVYAARVHIEDEHLWRPAAVNIGIRPMFEVPEGQVEAHILDFPDRDIYGKALRVRPVHRLRGEAKFESLEALKTQMALDCLDARSHLKNID